MSIHTLCPGCQSQFELQDDLAGQQVQCQNCQTVFVAPEPTSTPPAPPAPPSPTPQPPSKPSPASQETFMSVFDEVSETAGSASPAPSAFASPAPEPSHSYPAYGHEPQSSGGGKGLLLGGVLGCGILLLCGIGIGGWLIYRTVASSSEPSPFRPPALSDMEEFAKQARAETEKRRNDMIERLGTNKVAKVLVNAERSIGADGGAATRYLVDQAKKSLGNRQSSVMCQQAGTGKYEILIGPVTDLQGFADKLDWATVSKVDRSNREITISVKLPDKLASSSNPRNGGSNNPTQSNSDIAADLAKQRQALTKANEERRKELEQERIAAKKKRDEEAKQRAAERLADDARRQKEKAVRDADWNHEPRPNEGIVEWLQRTIDEDPAPGKAFANLAKMDVQQQHLETISGLLIEFQRNNGTSEFDEVLDAMLKWRTDESDQQILSLVGDPQFRLKGKALMQALEKIGTSEAAEKLAVALPDFFSGDGSVNHLIRLGEKAENAVLKYRKHQDPKVRGRVYRILTEVGTRASIDPLKQNRTLEKDQTMKQQVKDTIAAIEERHPEEDE